LGIRLLKSNPPFSVKPFPKRLAFLIKLFLKKFVSKRFMKKFVITPFAIQKEIEQISPLERSEKGPVLPKRNSGSGARETEFGLQSRNSADSGD
jgi:hypothetical protein